MANGNLRDDDYLSKTQYEKHSPGDDGFARFDQEGEYYFAYFDEGDLVLRSEGYTEEKGRDNGIASVQKNMGDDEQYQARELESGQWVLSLKAKNHQEIARSEKVSSETAALSFLPSSRAAAKVAKAKAQKEAEAAATALAAKSAAGTGGGSDRIDDDYLRCREYEDKPKSPQYDDFSVFEKGGEFYFAMLKNDGAVALRSEGYKSAAGRDNGIDSVRKNREIDGRYSIEKSRGRWYVVLKAGNRQEIGRSCAYESEAAANAFLFPPVIEKSMPKSERVVDEYLHCDEYKNKPKSAIHSDFSAFDHEGEYYFAMLKSDGSVALRSERYNSAGGRDNGINSVLKNRDIDGRYSVVKAGSKYFVVLKAGNHQEIGRSCPYNSEAAANAFLFPPVVEKSMPKSERVVDEYMHCDEYKNKSKSAIHSDFSAFDHEGEYYFAMLNRDGSVALRSERYSSAKARDNGIQSVIKNRDVDGRYSVVESAGKYYVILKAGNHQEIGRSCPFNSEASALAWIKDGGVIGGAAAAAGAALGAAGIGGAAVSAASLAGTAVPEPPKKPAPVQKAVPPKPPKKERRGDLVEDDYLVCSRYEGHKVTDKANNAALFQHENGQYYFVLYDKDGHVRWRSEGFESSKNRHEELMLVFKYKKDKKLRTRHERGGLHYEILKTPNGREIARSCMKKKVAPIAAAGGAGGIGKAAAATAAIAAATAASVAATPKPTPKATPKAKAKTPPPIAPAAAAASGGGFKWWWLLPLLLLIPLFLWWKGCNTDTSGAAAIKTERTAEKPTAKNDGSGNANAATNADTEAARVAAADKARADKAAADKAAADKAAADKAAAAQAAATCNCSALRHPVFNVPSGRAPKALTKLGTFPEFGNSHALDPAGFYNKLKNRAANNAVDKRFLDGISRAMGYGSFAELRPNMFSNAKITRGQEGNIGSGPNHKTVHRKLNTSPRDLEAFKIKASNGCDLHFMKTCGNHFFFCPN